MKLYKTSGFLLSYDYSNTTLSLFDSGDERGYRLWVDNSHEDYNFIIVGNEINGQEVSNFINEYLQIKELKQFLFNGGYSVVIIDKQQNKIFIQSDYLGVNPLYVNVLPCSGIVLSSSIGLMRAYYPIEINRDAAISHFGFGYHVSPHPFIYNLVPVKGNRYYCFDVTGGFSDKSYPFVEHIEYSSEQVDSLVQSFSLIARNGKCDIDRFYSLTSGKDSLVLVANESDIYGCNTGTFGQKGSADVLQSKKLNEFLHPKSYEYVSLCDRDEFLSYSMDISFLSGGLATLSYADMMKFVRCAIPNSSNFVMGEGGECVRSFFNLNETMEQSLDGYITPYEIIVSVMNADLVQEIGSRKDYIEKILTPILGHFEYDENQKEVFLTNFYRNGRMPGNFSLRHQILNPYRGLQLPFLSTDFIETFYALDPKYFKGSALHRKFIECNNANLLGYFDNPIQNSVTTQNWDHRLKTEILDILYSIFEHTDSNCIFDTYKIKKLIDMQRQKPDRGVWFLLRIASWFLFSKIDIKTVSR